MKTELTDNNGTPVQPLCMRCEYGQCNRTDGKDYPRPKQLSAKGWEDEPIFLCDDHAKEMKLKL